MTKSKYILRYTGKGPIPADDLERIRSLDALEVIDATSRMLLVESTESALKSLEASMPEWVVSRQRSISLPDPRPKVIAEPPVAKPEAEPQKNKIRDIKRTRGLK
jgi:hypothetical protein